MVATTIKTFPVANCADWSYATKLHIGTCVVDSQTIKMKFTVTLEHPTCVPDVLEIEEFCREMSAEPATLEGYTMKLAKRLGKRPEYTVIGKGKTRTHGVITCTVCETL